MYVRPNYKTKKELRQAIAAGKTVTIFQPGPFGGSEPTEGTTSVEGPHFPASHSWYARITLKDGKIIKVK